MTQGVGHSNGWTFDPTDETWYAKTGPNTWSVVNGALDDPPTFTPATLN
jgi:hypothetical protein